MKFSQLGAEIRLFEVPCSFTGNRYGLEARSTFSYVDDPLHVFNGSHFYATQSYYNITHIFSSGILGLRVEKSEFNRGAYAASFGGNTSFNINRNIFNGYRKSAIKLERTGSRIKQLDFNYLTSNFNTMVTGLSVFRDNFTFQFTSNCFNNPINDVKLELIPLFPDQGSISIANNNYFHPFSSNGPELFSRVTRFDYYIPTSGANSRATPHCHRLTTRPDPNCTTYSIHANVNALTTLPDPPNCEQMAMPDTLDENDYLIDTFAFTYLYNKYEFYKDQSSDLQSEIQNLPPNDPDSAGLASDLNLTQFYLKKYQMSLMQNLYAANDTGTLFDFLTNEEVDDHEMLIAGLEINKGNYAAADSILSELAPISADYDKYYTVEKIHLNFLSDPSSNFPTQNDSLDLESIAIDTSWASSYAKALLVLYYNRRIDTSLYGMDTLTQYSNFLVRPTKDRQSYSINNPIGQELIINFENPIKADIKLKLLDMSGKTIYSSMIYTNTKIMRTNLHELKSGPYIIELGGDRSLYPIQRIIKI